ncbi:MAG: hypothetical protein ACRBB2_05430 [Nitrosopumilus sp.]
MIIRTRLRELISNIEEQVKRDSIIPAEKYMMRIDNFIKESKIDEDEFLVKETENIGGQEFTVNSETITVRAEKESDNLRKEIINSREIASESESKIVKKIKENFSNNQELFKKVITEAKKKSIRGKSREKILEKNMIMLK